MPAMHLTWSQAEVPQVTSYLLGMTPVKWYSKRQNTVETSSYGAELVAMRITVEAILELRYMIRMMGIASGTYIQHTV